MAHPDYEEFLAELNAKRVRYLVGGAHALALHARPRATKDLDIFIDPKPPNAKRVVAAVRAFFHGTPPRYVTVANLLDEDTIVQLGVAPVRIDLVPQLVMGFRSAWSRRVDAPFGTVPAHFLSLEDLIAEKAHWARDQDLVDLKVLERAQARKARPRRKKPRPRR